MKLDLQLFAGGHTVTVTAGTNITAASASATTDVAKDAEVTLTVTAASGYEPTYVTVTGGVTVDPATKKFKMGEANVIIAVIGKADNLYKVTEPCIINVNDSKTVLTKNTEIKVTASGAIYDVASAGTAIAANADCIAALVEQGVLVKI